MHSVIGIAAILFVVCIQGDGQQITATSCGQRLSEPIPLMIDAFNASHYPWHAAIYHKDDQFVPQYKCGGTLIDSLSILTAAHCVSRYNQPMDAAKIFVSLGRLNLGVNESSSQSFVAEQIFLHSNYSAIDYNNDIAIIRLAQNANFNNYVQPVCLWNENKTELSEVVGSAGTVIGWGRTESAKKSDVLRQALMPVVTSLGCLMSNRAFVGSILSETNFCAGSRNGTSICEGDSGGSMTFEVNGLFYIRGIVLVTAQTHNETTQQFVCDPTQYAIFTDVAQYLPWINSYMRECVKIVRCDNEVNGTCRISLHINHSARKCRIIFGDDTDIKVKALFIVGELAALPHAINKFENLIGLHLAGVQLKTVDRATLATFSRIQLLDLSANEITELAPDTFHDLMDLSVLGLSSNSLKEIHVDVFQRLHNITEIQLARNQLENLPDGLFRDNQKLESVWLLRNKINILHGDVFKGLHNLRQLHLDYNRLNALPDGLFRDNPELEEILLSNNQINVLHGDVFTDLRNLKKVNLDDNRLEALPDGLFRNNEKLKLILLYANGIQVLHRDVFQGLHNLTEIHLDYNQLEHLPDGLFRDNRKLEQIVLHGNKINVLHRDVFKDLRNLQRVYLGNNRLEVLPDGLFRDNQKLVEISLVENAIRKIECNFDNMPNLVTVDFRDNICINEECDVQSFCGTTSMSEMHTKIWSKCPSY